MIVHPALPDPGRCVVIGIINVTPDSFSDGGRYLDRDDAVAHGLALRAQGADLEAGLATVSAGILSRLPAARREALLAVATIDLDNTDVEAYGRRKQVEACNYQGQRCGRPHVATWAELGGGPRRGSAGR